MAGPITPIKWGDSDFETSMDAPLIVTFGEVNREIRVNLHLDLSAFVAPVVTLETQAPSGATASWTMTQIQPSEGHAFAYYRTAAGDINETGIWLCRPKLVDGATDLLYGEAFQLRVKGLFEA